MPSSQGRLPSSQGAEGGCRGYWERNPKGGPLVIKSVGAESAEAVSGMDLRLGSRSERQPTWGLVWVVMGPRRFLGERELCRIGGDFPRIPCGTVARWPAEEAWR
jgi:hypothetical protein